MGPISTQLGDEPRAALAVHLGPAPGGPALRVSRRHNYLRMPSF
jgi:hypothetical protein